MIWGSGAVDTKYLYWKNEHKWPRLAEAAAHYGIPFDEDSLHNVGCLIDECKDCVDRNGILSTFLQGDKNNPCETNVS